MTLQDFLDQDKVNTVYEWDPGAVFDIEINNLIEEGMIALGDDKSITYFDDRSVEFYYEGPVDEEID